MHSATHRAIIGLVIVTVILAAAPWWAGRSELRLIGEMMSYLALAVLWNLLAGYAGLMSVGQQAFVGIGGYTLFCCCIWFGFHPFLAIPMAMVTAGIAAAIFAPLLFRLVGAYFAIGTWVAAETVALAVSIWPEIGGGAGMSLPAQVVRGIADSRDGREAMIYWALLVLGLGTLAGTWALVRSKAGLALMALRDNPIAAGSVGIDIARIRRWTWIGVATVTGAIGAVIFLQKLRISPDAGFSLNDWTVVVIFIVVIGGIGRIEGAIVGTLVYFLLRETLADYGSAYLIVIGIVAILTMTFSRGGLWGLIERFTGITLLPTTRRRDTD